jgi:hypothetical protein
MKKVGFNTGYTDKIFNYNRYLPSLDDNLGFWKGVEHEVMSRPKPRGDYMLATRTLS